MVFIERNAMTLQKMSVFILESEFSVMLSLIRDVVAYRFNLGFADRKGSVT